MNDPLQSHDIDHTCATYGVSVTSDIIYNSDKQVWAFKGVNYKQGDSMARDYIAYREENTPGIRIRQIRTRTSD